ncbi:hypothetical protein D8W73_16365 [Citrobacter amalonaticus]|nr:hypothetical protein [Citrobacter amalonaticus]
MRTLLIIPVSALLLLNLSAELQAAPGAIVPVQSDVATPIARAPCIRPPESSPVGKIAVEKDGALSVASITVPQTQQAPFVVTLDTGETNVAPCPGDKPLLVQIIPQPQAQISSASVQQAFVVLMAAFVLALLMESAFALLFNWRLFQTFVVGRAWRTPVMLAGAWLVVSSFKLDLMAELFSAYRGFTVTGGMFTELLTAMIISGGSVGVNKILVGLGFRSAIPRLDPNNDRDSLSQNEAWVSLDISAIPPGRRLSVEMLEDAPSAGTIPTLAIFTPPGEGRLKALMFPSRARLPASGGMRVTALDKRYYFAIRDLNSNQLYDVNGNKIPDIKSSTPYCFAARAIVDFSVVKLQP